MTEDEIIAVVTGHKEGKTIQLLSTGREEWHDTDCPAWNFGLATYRIKPEPREFMLNLQSGGIVELKGTEVYATPPMNIRVREVMDD